MHNWIGLSTEEHYTLQYFIIELGEVRCFKFVTNSSSIKHRATQDKMYVLLLSHSELEYSQNFYLGKRRFYGNPFLHE